mmetsp:Transcript_5135/g.9750  ORF Transcript_5135/g.9750 Transcript_5135/m.9750 type:complete len:1274 (+) Transcript_5135:102-3923(+)
MAELQTAPTMEANNLTTVATNPFDFDDGEDDNHGTTITPSRPNHHQHHTSSLFVPVVVSPDAVTHVNTNGSLLSPSSYEGGDRSKRLREENIRRLVSDIQRTASNRANDLVVSSMAAISNTHPSSLSSSLPSSTVPPGEISKEQQDEEILIASALATSIERGLDRELYHELSKEVKTSASNISKICHEHSDDFLNSVGRVVGIGKACDEINHTIEYANKVLQQKTVQPMLEAARQLEYVKSISARSRMIHAVMEACFRVSTLLERAKKQAALGRSRGALDAVDEARACLTASLASLMGVGNEHSEEMKKLFQDLLREEEILVVYDDSGSANMVENSGNAALRKDDGDNGSQSNYSNNNNNNNNSNSNSNNNKMTQVKNDRNKDKAEKNELRLEDTPFGLRAMELLPKIENEVIMGARRGLNKWFLSIRSGGDGAKAGRAALRKCAASMAIGPGQLGIGGRIQGYTWRAKNADNLISRVSQGGRIARAIRMGYWFSRDNEKEIERLTRFSNMGVGRKAEAFASAFGWYRCWSEYAPLDVDEGKAAEDEDRFGRSSHGNRSSHGISRSGHGNLGGSRHGRSLNFRASHRRDASLSFRTGVKDREQSAWSSTLIPAVLLDDTPTKAEDEEKLATLPESVHPVRRAEAAFALLGKTEEFRQYYEQNRFGDMKIGDKDDDGFVKETRSSLSSLTGDDVSQGTDRIFFSRSLPHFCTSIAGFSAIEAALELGIVNEVYGVSKMQNGVASPVDGTKEPTSSFTDSSARYERRLIAELGSLIRNRAIGATLVELSKASFLLTAFRGALKILHPSSTTRTYDKELLAMDVDILMTGLKVAQEEQLRATSRILSDDSKDPMIVARSDFRYANQGDNASNIPVEEVIDVPFGLNDLKQKSSVENTFNDYGSSKSHSYGLSLQDGDTYKFSPAIPLIMRSIHSRTIAFAAFAMSQEELGQVFPMNKGVGAAGYVLDCLEQCVSIAAIGIKDSYEHLDELSVPEAVQITANISSLQSCLPRLFGVITRGLCHVGMIPEDQLNKTFEYAEETLTRADKACDAQVASMFNAVYELCRNKIDALLHFSLDSFQWVAKSARETPNTYCESLIEYLRTIFKCLRSLDEGSKAGLHFSCCGHISERLVMLVAGKASEEVDNHTSSNERHGLRPISKIDAFGLKNLSIDITEFESFADGTGIPQLRDCFIELRCITDAMLDPELPKLLMPENENVRRRKYPFLSLEKVCNVLEKYQGTGLGGKLMGSGNKGNSFLMLEKKDIAPLIKLAKSQL